MRKLLITLCVIAQLSVLAYMVFTREAIITNGREISLRTAPIDPRDPFRGDFVRLRYAINELHNGPTRWQPEDYLVTKGDRIFAVLTHQPSGLYELEYFTNTNPEDIRVADQVVLRGRAAAHQTRFSTRLPDVKFGIEQLFVEQDKGIDIEQRQGVRGGLQNAMHVVLAVSDNGTAVLKDYTWSDLAIELEVTDAFREIPAITTADTHSTEPDQPFENPEATRTNERDNNPDTQNERDGNQDSLIDSAADTPPVRLHIKNVSDQPVTLNNPGDNCGFALEPASRFASTYTAANNDCTENTTLQPLTLQPQQVITLNIDLSQPRWHVQRRQPESQNDVERGDVRSVAINSTDRFRLVYRSQKQQISEPTQEPAQKGQQPPFWSGDLVSQAFDPRGIID